MPDRHESWFVVETTEVEDHERGLRPEACGESSPGGKMLCDLPATQGSAHWHGQHVGVDWSGCFRGWKDKRPRSGPW